MVPPPPVPPGIVPPPPGVVPGVSAPPSGFGASASGVGSSNWSRSDDIPACYTPPDLSC